MSSLASSLRTLTDPSFRARLGWAVRVRWLVIFGFLALAAFAHRFGLFISIRPCVFAAAVGTAMNLLNQWGVARWRGVLAITMAALGGDLILITYVTINTGGVQSPFITMYVVQVLATAMLVGTAIAAIVAALSVALLAVALGAEATGVYHGLGLAARGGEPIETTLAYRAAWSGFLLYALALLVYLGGYVSERLSASERDLAEKNRRLEEAVAAQTAANAELSSAYDRLQQAEVHLVQAEKMNALGQLVAGVAHELNNPISFVSANIEHLREYTGQMIELLNAYDTLPLAGEDRARVEGLKRAVNLPDLLADLPSLLDDCEEGAQRTKRIVTELRTFSRSDEPNDWRRVDLHRCLDSTLALLSHRLKNRVVVHRDFGDLPDVECVPGQINQVFMNLLANAADAVGTAGNIWIVTRALAATVSESRPARDVTVAIRDDGSGIRREVQSRIFDPFFTTKDVGKGTGLGLSVSYSIVARHHGTLRFDSMPGCGTTFTLRLPVDQPTRLVPT
jgi:two-component system NtrC family sensor kinase